MGNTNVFFSPLLLLNVLRLITAAFFLDLALRHDERKLLPLAAASFLLSLIIPLLILTLDRDLWGSPLLQCLIIILPLFLLTPFLMVMVGRRKTFPPGGSQLWLLIFLSAELFLGFKTLLFPWEMREGLLGWGLIITEILLMVFIVRLLGDLSVVRYQQEEEGYKKLFQTAPISLWEEDASLTVETLIALKEQGIADIRSFFDHHPETLWETAGRLGVLDVNEETLKLFEAPDKKTLIQRLPETFTPQALATLKEAMINLFQGNQHISLETSYKTLKGNHRDILVDFHFPRMEATTKKTIISMVDITERKKAQEQLEKSLTDKEILLKEVHHRVKNNLAVITSLIDLQMMKNMEQETKDLLMDIENRVRTMALVHEHLYKNSDLKDIAVRNYVSNLLETLMDSYWMHARRPLIELEIDDILLGLDTLIPLGLIINEIFSNSLKHAFSGETPGKVYLSLKGERDRIQLVMGDDGAGLPPEEELNETESLGWMLIQALTQQIKAQLTIDRQGGSRFTLTFPAG